jgi:serine/threonine protein kinase
VHQQGIVHRDIKPQNVMIGASGEPLLMDFGLARSPAAPQHSGMSSFRGTIPYAAPEAFHAGIASPRTDIYGLGVLLYHLLAGATPFDPLAPDLSLQILSGHHTPLRDVRPDVAPQLEQICAKAMARKPANRFGSADEMAQALSVYLEGEKRCDAAPAILTISGKRIGRSRPVVAGLGLFGLLVACGMFVWGGWKHEQPPPKTLLTNVPRLPVQQWRADGGCMVIQFSPDGSAYYSVLNPAFPRGATDKPCSFVIGDAKTGEIRSKVPFHLDWQTTRGLAVSKSGDAYISDFYAKTVARIRKQSSGEIEYIPITSRNVEHPWVSDIAITPDESTLIAMLGHDGQEPDFNNDYVAIVDLSSQKLAELQLNDEPQSDGLCVARDGKNAYIATFRRKSKNATLYELQLKPPCSISRRAAIPCDTLWGVAYCERKRCIFVGDSQNSVIWQVSRDTFAIKKWASLDGYSPRLMAIDPMEKTLAVHCKNQVLLFDLETTRVKAYANNSMTGPLRFDPSGNRLFVAGSCADGVKFIDLNSPPCAPEPTSHVPWRNERERLDSFVFAAMHEGQGYHLYWMDEAATRQPTQLTFRLADDWAPVWSPNDDAIAFVSDRDGAPRVCVLDPAVGDVRVFEKTRVSDLQKAFRTPVTWLPGGTKIAYIASGDVRIETVDRTTGEISQLFGPELAAEQGLPMIFHVCCDVDQRSYWISCRTHDSHNTAEVFLVSSAQSGRTVK